MEEVPPQTIQWRGILGLRERCLLIKQDLVNLSLDFY